MCSIIQNTQILRVEGFASKPKMAVDIANEVANQFVIFYNRHTQGLAQKSYEFIESQIPQVDAKLREAERVYYQFQMANHTSGLTVYREKLIGALSTLEDNWETASRELVEAEKKIQAVLEKMKKIPELKESTRTYQINPRIDYLAKKIADSEGEIGYMSAKLTPKHLLVAQERSKLTDFKNQLRQQVNENFSGRTMGRYTYFDTLVETLGTAEINRAVYSARKQVYGNQVADKKTQLSDLIDKEKEQVHLERQVTALKTALTNLLSNKQTARLGMEFPLSNAQVMEWAELPGYEKDIKSYRWFPKRLKLIMIAIILSLFLGLAVIFLQEYLEESFSDPQEAESALQFPVLGTLPELPHLNNPSVAQLMRIQPWERAVNLLGAMLQSTEDMSVPVVLAVTSARAQEGKSLVAASLGQVLAREDLSVLLMDLNFSHPSLEALWEFPRQPGVREILRGTKSMQECLKPLGKNLYLIGTGHDTGFSLSKKNQEALATWLASLKEQFKVILLDLPAVEEGEGAFLTSLADQTLVVVAAHQTSKALVARALELIKRCRGKVKGIVLNGMRPDSLNPIPQKLMVRWEELKERAWKFREMHRW